jgi:hypothetical protein
MSIIIQKERVKLIAKEITITDNDFGTHSKTAKIILDNHFEDSELSDSLLSEIGTYLTAHFAALAQPIANELEIEDIKEKRNIKTGKGLEQTTFGQHAKFLDTSGTLDKLDKRKRTIVFEAL